MSNPISDQTPITQRGSFPRDDNSVPITQLNLLIRPLSYRLRDNNQLIILRLNYSSSSPNILTR